MEMYINRISLQDQSSRLRLSSFTAFHIRALRDAIPVKILLAQSTLCCGGIYCDLVGGV